MDQQWNQPGYRPGNNYFGPNGQGTVPVQFSVLKILNN